MCISVEISEKEKLIICGPSTISILANIGKTSKNSSTDYYTTLRTMYLQNRQKKLDFEEETENQQKPSYDVDFEIEEDEN